MPIISVLVDVVEVEVSPEHLDAIYNAAAAGDTRAVAALLALAVDGFIPVNEVAFDIIKYYPASN